MERIPLPAWLRRGVARESAFWAVLLLAVPILAVGLTLILEPVDPDYWWHLATGNWILAHHRVPFTDPFSWTHGGQPWIAHEWLAELLLALANRAAGYAGALLLTGVIAVSGYWLLLRAARCYGLSRRALALLMLLWGGIPLWALAVRPQVWGWALLCLLLSELAAYQTGRRHQLWALPLLFVVWININLTALIGIGCLGLFALDRLVREIYLTPRPPSSGGMGRKGESNWPTDRAPALSSRLTTHDSRLTVDWHLLEVCIACVAALLVNPHGAELLRFAFKYADPNALRYRFIGEWQRPDIHDLTLLPFWLAAPMLVPAAWMLLRRRALWPAALVLIFFAESIKAQRYTPIYGLMLIPFAGWIVWSKRHRGAQDYVSIPQFAGDDTLRTMSGGRGQARPAVASSVVAFLPPGRTRAIALAGAAFILALATFSGRSEFRITPNPRGYPAMAATVLRQQYPHARLFNTYTWGGYLIGRLYPAVPVYVDGREEMYGDAFLRRFLALAAGDPSWQATFDREGINAALVEQDAGIASALRTALGWRVAYQDDRAVLFVRSP